MAEVANVKGPEFAGAASHDGTRITTRLTGNADTAAVELVGHLLRDVHSAATRLSVNEAVLDLRDLEFMNSSCFKNLLSWLNDILDLAPVRRYRVRIISNPEIHWQRRSMHALQAFALDLIVVDPG
jgi:hypothetical protein